MKYPEGDEVVWVVDKTTNNDKFEDYKKACGNRGIVSQVFGYFNLLRKLNKEPAPDFIIILKEE